MVNYNNSNLTLIFIFLCIIVFWLMVLCEGCAPVVKDHIIIPEIEIPQEEKFVPVEGIKKPKKPKPVFYTNELVSTDDPKKIEYFAFTSDEFSKILQLSKSFDAQDKVIRAYIDIIDFKVKINNDLRKILNDRNLIIQYYADLYIDENNLRLQENYINKKDKIINRSIIVIQGIVLLAVIL